MKAFTVRLPDALIAKIEGEARRRKLSKSGVVRELLTLGPSSRRPSTVTYAAIADLVGSVDGLPKDLSSKAKRYLKRTDYGAKRALNSQQRRAPRDSALPDMFSQGRAPLL